MWRDVSNDRFVRQHTTLPNIPQTRLAFLKRPHGDSTAAHCNPPAGAGRGNVGAIEQRRASPAAPLRQAGLSAGRHPNRSDRGRGSASAPSVLWQHPPRGARPLHSEVPAYRAPRSTAGVSPQVVRDFDQRALGRDRLDIVGQIGETRTSFSNRPVEPTHSAFAGNVARAGEGGERRLCLRRAREIFDQADMRTTAAPPSRPCPALPPPHSPSTLLHPTLRDTVNPFDPPAAVYHPRDGDLCQ
mmetsp:Transcript_96439/g.274953  ORF Transcript_96439/g.274953 Transcript_96439/m.274953 type:complete len:243 (+) Transcript_96439:164-892(+)